MEVRFSSDIEMQLQQIASRNGIDAEQLVKKTVNRMLEDQARFVAAVHKGIDQADRGDVLEHQEVLNRIHQLFQP